MEYTNWTKIKGTDFSINSEGTKIRNDKKFLKIMKQMVENKKYNPNIEKCYTDLDDLNFI
jgi:hypothetical protein